MLESLTPEERLDLIMSVGVHVKRRRASPMHLAQLIKKAMTVESLEAIAKHVNLQDTTILRKLLSLNLLPDEVQDLVHWGRSDVGISFSVAAEIARSENESNKRVLAHAAIEHRLSKSEVQAIVQRTKRSDCTLEESVGEILKLRPAIDRQYLYVGQLEARVTIDTATRNIRRNLAKLVGPENVLSVRCSPGRFSVVLNDAGANSKQAIRFLGSRTLQSYINGIAGR